MPELALHRAIAEATRKASPSLRANFYLSGELNLKSSLRGISQLKTFSVFHRPAENEKTQKAGWHRLAAEATASSRNASTFRIKPVTAMVCKR